MELAAKNGMVVGARASVPRRPRLDPAATSKVCIQCGVEKPLEDYYPLHKGSPARQSRCKRCDNDARARSNHRDAAGARTGLRVRSDSEPANEATPPEDAAPEPEKPEDELAARTFRAYEREERERCGLKSRPADHPDFRSADLDVAEVERWANEAYAELVAGVSVRDAVDRANAPPDGLGPEEPTLSGLTSPAPATPPVPPPRPALVSAPAPRVESPRPAFAPSEAPQVRWKPPRSAASNPVVPHVQKPAAAPREEKPREESPMVTVEELDKLRDDVVAYLKEHGPQQLSDLAEAVKPASMSLNSFTSALRVAKSRGLLTTAGLARAARWSVPGKFTTGVKPKAPPKTLDTVARKHREVAKTPKSTTNGVGLDAVTSLRAVREKIAGQLAAVDAALLALGAEVD